MDLFSCASPAGVLGAHKSVTLRKEHAREDIGPCNTYHAKDAGRRLLKLPDGKSIFKVYFVDIVGRQQPERFVWGLCGHVRIEQAGKVLTDEDLAEKVLPNPPIEK